MPQICLKVSEPLHQQILLTMQEMGLDNVSATVRLLLNSALERDTSTHSKSSTHRLQNKTTSYTIMAYCLIETFLATSVKNGPTLSEEAHDKAEKLINALMSKLPRA